MPRYTLKRVDITWNDDRQATWSFVNKAVRGTEWPAVVTDGNHSRRNTWEFVVQVPTSRAGRIIIRPVRAPNDKAWADLTRVALTFQRATIGRYAERYYCQVSLIQPRGKGTRKIVKRSQMTRLPYWFKPLFRRMKAKETVRRTRGTDAKALVALVTPDDYANMIRLFFAMKVWPRKRAVSLNLTERH